MRQSLFTALRASRASHRITWALGGLITLGMCSCQSLHSPNGRESSQKWRVSETPQFLSRDQVAQAVPDAAASGWRAPAGAVTARGGQSFVRPVVANEMSPESIDAGYAAPPVTNAPHACGGACCQPAPKSHLHRGLYHPPDEYLCDGGDRRPAASVDDDWNIQGVGLEDTIAHYDTIHGDTKVVNSNQECIYAPRFAAVRRVTGIWEGQQWTTAGRAIDTTAANEQQLNAAAGRLNLPLATVRNVRNLSPQGLGNVQQGSLLRKRLPPREFRQRLLPFENIEVISSGEYALADEALLAEGVSAAISWSNIAAPQITVGRLQVDLEKASRGGQEVYHYHIGEDAAELRVVKIASTKHAQPGDTVHFTLRFDNVGDEEIGNVTIVDNLTTRLEYVEESQQCSVDANFDSLQNEGESLRLQWDIIKSLRPNEGGIIQFDCKVR
ncbi:MAG: DUF11 domain-containing protein [Planctomycetales bacterium]|nr:DUF11 domain-containing protein [Planctomycetales bacterium]